MNEFDAYAPPKVDLGSGAPRTKSKKKKASGAIADAIARLNEHLQDAQAVARDRQEVGGKLRTPTIIFTVISAILIVAAALFASSSSSSRDSEAVMLVLGLLGAVFGLITVILLVVDLRFLPRDTPASPENTLKHFFKAIAMGRFGYAWAALCPTAREQTVETPPLGAISVSPGTFRLTHTNALKDYTQTFARPGNGQMRTMQIKRATLLSEDGDVAVVEVEAAFQSWPQWAQMISVIGFVIIRLLGIILFLILYFTLRKTHEMTFRKTLIRGSNGIWYVYSGDLLEGASESN